MAGFAEAADEDVTGAVLALGRIPRRSWPRWRRAAPP